MSGWTAPRTWTPALVTVDELNEQIRDNISALASCCQVYNSATQNLPSGGAFSTLTFDSELCDSDAYHDVVSNTSRIVFPFDGRFRVYGSIRIATSGDTAGFGFDLRILFNGTDEVRRSSVRGGSGTTAGPQSLDVERIVVATAGDYVELQAANSGASALTIDSGGNTVFGAEFKTP